MSIQTRFQLLKYRRTRIIATLGPSSNDVETICSLLKSGANVFRLNFSHGTHATHRELHGRIREAGERTGIAYSILADLSGPKIRVGRFKEGGMDCPTGSTVTVTTREVEGGDGLIPSQYSELAGDVAVGDRILLDDGNLEFKVRAVEGTEITCRVVNGGFLKDNKGMNLPGVEVSAPALTEKDKQDARFAIELGVGVLALSFVRRAADVEALRALTRELVDDIVIISKIEKPEALECIGEILSVSDGIMIARGDLGVELPPERVPVAQEQLILEARRCQKPVIVATQMLESMMVNPRPTRAEVSDVSHAVRAGADGIMLSGESAAGKFPVEAVRMMDMIARQTEGHLWSEGAFGGLGRGQPGEPPVPVEDAVGQATALLSRRLRVRCIVVLSRSGRSISVMSATRPAAPIVGVTYGSRACHLSNLQWGVIPVTMDAGNDEEEIPLARRLSDEFELAEPGQHILLVHGFSDDPERNMPEIQVLTV